MIEIPGVLTLPAREVPVPQSVSPQAQAIIAMGPREEHDGFPALDDAEAWKQRAAEHAEQIVQLVGQRLGSIPVHVEQRTVGQGVAVYVVEPPGFDPADDRVVLDIHGGGFFMGGGDCCRIMAIRRALTTGMRIWAVDYRMPPDHPYPTPLDDCVAAYRAVLQHHAADRLVVSGDSAGGNLAAAMILRARDEGVSLPRAAVLVTPEVDLTESGDSFNTNVGLDNVLASRLMPANLLYAGGHDLSDPYLSPLFADLSKGFPPTILTSGTRDLFLSNTVLFHRALRRAKVRADLHVVEAAAHGGFLGQAPEDDEILAEIRHFIAEWCPGP